MRVYTAHVHARKPPVLVPEGFTWGGFLFGPLWLLARGAWTLGVITLALLVALCAFAPPALRPSLAFALFLVIGLFGTDLRRWSLWLRAYDLEHVVTGRDQDEAFVRLLSARPLLSETEV